MTQVCSRCGTHLESRVRFCVQCGTPVGQPGLSGPTLLGPAVNDPTGHDSFPIPRVPGGPAPAVWPTVLVTALLGLLGLVPAAISASAAQGRGRPTGPYWKAFALTLVIAVVVWSGIGAAGFLLLRNQVDLLATPAPASTQPVAETGRTPDATATIDTPTNSPPTTTSPPLADPAPTTVESQTVPTTTRPPTTRPPTTRPPTTTRPGSQWPPYRYSGPADLCRTSTFPEPALIKVGSGYKPAAHSAEAALVALGYDGVTVDGYFDQASAAALARFQANHGLVADGTLGQQSWTQLRASLNQYAKC